MPSGRARARQPVTARYERELREQLPDYLKDAKLTGTSTWLYRGLRDAEAAGLDSRQVLARAINSGSLADVRDVGAVLDARVRQQTQGLVPQPPKPWAERVPEDDHAASGTSTSPRSAGRWMTGSSAWANSPRRPRPAGQSALSARCPTIRTNGRPGRTGHPRWPPTARCSPTATRKSRSARSLSTRRRPGRCGTRRSLPSARSTARTCAGTVRRPAAHAAG